MAAEDAVSLLRSLKAAGEKTGAVEAEGALHLRRTSRRTLDGFHDGISLPAPKFPSAAAAATSSAPPTSASLSSSSGPLLIPTISFGANLPSFASGSSPGNNNNGAATTGANNSNLHGGGGGGGGITLTFGSSGSGSLPVITSTASSPGASPSRLSVRPPAPLNSLPSPTGTSPGRGGGGGSAAAALGLSCGPPSPPCPGASHASSPGLPRRSIHAYSSNGTAYDFGQLPYSHGSPLPLIFDPPVCLPPPPPPPAAASPNGGGIPGLSSPGSPGIRQVQLSAAAAAGPQPPSCPSPSSLPSIAIASGGSGGGGGGGGLPPPAAPAPNKPSLLPPSSRTVSARGSVGGGAAGNLLAAAAGGGSVGGGSTLSKSVPTANGASPTGSISPGGSGGGGGGGGRPLPLRPPPGPGTPFGLSQAAAAAAPPSPVSSSSASSPVPGLASHPARCGPNALPDSGSSFGTPRSLPAGSALAALQLQLQATVPTLQQQPPPHSARPSSARSIAGGAAAVPEGLSGTLSSRRLSMTGAFESSQKLVLAAAHELSSLQHHSQLHYQHQHQLQQQSGQQTLQQMLPPPQLAGTRQAISSARGSLVTGGGGAAAAAALPRVTTRDARSSDPGTCGGSTAAPVEFGFLPMPESLPAPTQTLLGRPSLAPLPPGAVLQAAGRVSMPHAAPPSSSGLGWPPATANAAPCSPQLSLRAAARPEPLPQRPEASPPPPQAAAAAVSTSLPEPLQPRQEALPPLPAGPGAAAAAAVAPQLPLTAPGVPLGRAGALSPLGLSDEPPAGAGGATAGAGPVAESTLDSTTPNLDPAALFGPGSGSGSRGGFMELTVRSMALQPASPGLGGGGSGGAGSDRFAVQSSVRQRLQTDPLRFHPPTAAGGVRRPGGGAGYLDPLEATPRLVLAGGAVSGGGSPPLRVPSWSRLDSPNKTGGAAGGPLWVPNQDILPHMVSRGSSGGGGGSRLVLHAASSSPTGAAAAAAPLALTPATPSLELRTPRLRSTSGSTAGDGTATGPQPRGVPASGELHSSYLKALAAAAGLDGGGGGGGRLLQRQRSLSDSGCCGGGGGGGGVSFLAAAADSGPVGLPLEGGLAVLGDVMWSRVRAERNHNTRYDTASDAAAAAAGGELSGALDDALALRAVAEAEATTGPLPPVGDPWVGGAGPLDPGRGSYSDPHQASPTRNLSSTSSVSITATSGTASGGGGAAHLRGSSGVTHGSAHAMRLDASVSSLPLKALRASPGAAAGGRGAAEGGAAGGAVRAKP